MNTDLININYFKFELSNFPVYCGNDVCDMVNEDCQSCPEDCGECPVYCSDYICQRWEGCNTCYFINGSAGSYINSWNTQQVDINGTNITNIWMGSQNYPTQIDGGYYLYYNGGFPWSHVEVR